MNIYYSHKDWQKGPKSKMYRKSYVLAFIMFLCFLCSFPIIVKAQESPVNPNYLSGDWEGNIILSEDKVVGILWHFEASDAQPLKGFMGPASKGVATLEMQELQYTESSLAFSIQSEGHYTGTITDNEIKGTWSTPQGKSFVLNMYRELTEEQLLKRTANKALEHDIHQYIELGNTEKVAAFLQKGNDINALYHKGFRLLHYAIKHDRNAKMVKYLLEQGADPNLDVEGISPLMFAVGYQKHHSIQALINYDIDVNRISPDKETALSFAIRGRDPKAVKLLLDAGADPKLEISKGHTAMALAKKENHREISALLQIPYEEVSDGPYITRNKTHYTAMWVHKGKAHQKTFGLNIQDPIVYKGMQARPRNTASAVSKTLEYQGSFRIAAVSDIHGQYDTFIALLQNHGILDPNDKWNFGNGHFVVAGDIFDRGPQVMEVLWFLYDLEAQAEEKGGKVHILLGNHDVMVLNGNLRSIHPKYKEVSQILGQPLNTLFSKESILGSWLRTKPVAIKVNDLLFTHGGFHPDLVSKGVSLAMLNNEFQKQLVASEMEKDRNDLGNYLHQGNGPIYYRGYFQGDRARMEEIDQLLAHFRSSTIIVGHTTHRNIETHYQGKVIVIDANLKSGKAGELLFWDTGKFTRGTLEGSLLPLAIEHN
ncbi:ankyrin repeat domain-containing protein [Spongiimicrobium salis]|uniref:ankyrin repeat domain-containing protein n=1 Tax=Spongiimicrobium salis TaxID=1667022 RepID=UPI00374D0EE5